MWRTAATAVAALCLAGQASAQTPAFCQAGWDAIGRHLMNSISPAPPDTALVYSRCAAGDTIIIPTAMLGFIAEVCDGSRPINVIGRDAICTVSPKKDIRSERR